MGQKHGEKYMNVHIHRYKIMYVTYLEQTQTPEGKNLLKRKFKVFHKNFCILMKWAFWTAIVWAVDFF